MNFNIIPLDESHYDEVLVGWWKDWNFVPPLKDFLPDNGKGGMIVYENLTPICAGFLYITNSNVAWINWIVSNKEYKFRKKRTQAFNLLINTLINIALNNKKTYVFANNNNPSLINRYLKLGFLKGCISTELIYKI